VTREEHRTIVTQDPLRASAPVASETHDMIEVRPSGGEMARRIAVLVFGIIQLLIATRIVLLLIDAQESNGLVSAIYAFSQLFVAPFEGMLGTDALAASGSILDLAAVVALAGWSILELIVLWAINVFRREPA
jgi:YGGT family